MSERRDEGRCEGTCWPAVFVVRKLRVEGVVRGVDCVSEKFTLSPQLVSMSRNAVVAKGSLTDACSKHVPGKCLLDREQWHSLRL